MYLNHLIERLDFALHYEAELAQLAGVRLRCCEPLREAGLVNEPEGSRAETRFDQRTHVVRLMADPAEVAARLARLTRRRSESRNKLLLKASRCPESIFLLTERKRNRNYLSARR